MDDGEGDELRELQARAYGPQPDIDADPAARRRLDELESRARGRSRPRADDPPTAPDATALPVAPPSPSAIPPAPPLPRATAELVGAAATGHGERARRVLTGIAWAGSLAVVATLAVAATAAVTSRTAWIGTTVAPGASVSHVVTLHVDENRAAPGFIGDWSRESVVFEEFFGMVASRITAPGSGSAAVCVMIVSADAYEASESEGYAGPWFQGCGYEPFDTAVSLPVDDQSPQELRDRFPVGARLQFVSDGDVIEVFVAEAAATQASE